MEMNIIVVGIVIYLLFVLAGFLEAFREKIPRYFFLSKSMFFWGLSLLFFLIRYIFLPYSRDNTIASFGMMLIARFINIFLALTIHPTDFPILIRWWDKSIVITISGKPKITSGWPFEE